MTMQKGFSIVEMMVGVTLGLLGMLAVSGVLVSFNSNRNATTQTMESQNNGTMALYLMERDLTQAGYGLMSIQDCPTINWYYNGSLQTPLTTLPVRITDGAAAADSLQVQYAKSTAGVPATQITQNQNALGDSLFAASIVGLVSGNLVVADVAGACTLYAVTAVDKNPASPTYGSLAHANTNSYNPATNPGTGWDMVQVGNTLANLGSDPQLNLVSRFISKRYSISASGLEAATFPTYSSSPLVDNIVFMKAQYGRDTNGDGVVDLWSSGAWIPDNTTANQVIALRIGIVARSTEKIAINAPASFTLLPELKDAAGTVIGAEVSYTPPDTTYRHKSYSTIIPLRNVIWNN